MWSLDRRCLKCIGKVRSYQAVKLNLPHRGSVEQDLLRIPVNASISYIASELLIWNLIVLCISSNLPYTCRNLFFGNVSNLYRRIGMRRRIRPNLAYDGDKVRHRKINESRY
jgi:hypothetical protein